MCLPHFVFLYFILLNFANLFVSSPTQEEKVGNNYNLAHYRQVFENEKKTYIEKYGAYFQNLSFYSFITYSTSASLIFVPLLFSFNFVFPQYVFSSLLFSFLFIKLELRLCDNQSTIDGLSLDVCKGK